MIHRQFVLKQLLLCDRFQSPFKHFHQLCTNVKYMALHDFTLFKRTLLWIEYGRP